ncbi:MAG: GNAT family N-acetyltransferase, partial [Anaerolineales bacterium]
PYREDDFEILQATLGVAEMTAYLGGPESEEKLRSRHARYVALPNTGHNAMYVILAGPQEQPAGTVGYWEHEHDGQQAWETGWAVVPAWQGHGIATQATLAAAALAHAQQRHRYFFAYPTVENLASNAVSRKAGFELLGTSAYEYPKGNPIICNVWRLDQQTLPHAA